uniref:G-protein coupled receptors family 1 profile domain-containing protein n=1 Tax=Naja naja TaxID=35670 RepID=A0A8C7DS15_NAJNA
MSAPDSLPEGFTEFDMMSFGTVMLTEALFGFSLNVLTIVAFWKIKEIQTPGNFLILNLALSDCGICINAFIAAFSSFLRYWPYGSDGCQIHGFQGFLTSLTSINCAAAIAWDRYHQYCSRRKLQWNSVFFMGLFVWCSAGFWSAMPLLGWGSYDYEPLRTCCTLDYTKGDRSVFLRPNDRRRALWEGRLNQREEQVPRVFLLFWIKGSLHDKENFNASHVLHLPKKQKRERINHINITL